MSQSEETSCLPSAPSRLACPAPPDELAPLPGTASPILEVMVFDGSFDVSFDGSFGTASPILEVMVCRKQAPPHFFSRCSHFDGLVIKNSSSSSNSSGVRSYSLAATAAQHG